MDKSNEVMASWNLKYYDLEDYLRLYIDFQDDTPIDTLIQNQWVGPYRTQRDIFSCSEI